MKKSIQGIKSVDLKITAKGHGVVNWNGSTTLMNNGIKVDNHTMPKLRGFSNLTGKVKAENGYQYKKDVSEISFEDTPLYISANCIRHHLFKEQSYDFHFANTRNINEALVSLTGLVRGFMLATKSPLKRTSALLVEDFVDQLGNGNYEQFTRSGVRDSASIFSKTTFGDTEYLSYASINIEELQFICLDNKFDRQAIAVNSKKRDELAQQIEAFLNDIKSDAALTPVATFHENYVRKGAIFDEGEEGILLNNDAIKILVTATIEKVSELTIQQGKGYTTVTSVEVDYNDSHNMMRIKHDDSFMQSTPQSDFACYYYSTVSTVEKIDEVETKKQKAERIKAEKEAASE